MMNDRELMRGAVCVACTVCQSVFRVHLGHIWSFSALL